MGSQMRLPIWVTNAFVSFFIVLIAGAMLVTDELTTERVEEYLALSHVTGFSHENLAEQMPVFSAWRTGRTWNEAISAVASPLLRVVGWGRQTVSDEEVERPTPDSAALGAEANSPQSVAGERPR